jgi:hypothetical protein
MTSGAASRQFVSGTLGSISASTVMTPASCNARPAAGIESRCGAPILE